MAQLTTYPVPSVGGLDLVSPTQVLSQKPGAAVMLNNMVSLPEGGYARVNGYTAFGDIPDGFGELPVRGVYPYKGVVAVVGDVILHSPDGASFFPVNGQDCTNIPSKDLHTLTRLPRPGTGRVGFAKVNIDGNEEVVITDSVGKPAILKVVGDLYTYREVTAEGVVGMRYASRYQDHVVLASSKDKPGTVALSARFKPDDFSGQGSWSVQVQDEITGIHVFRDYLYIFCHSAIYRVINLESSANVAVRPVTTKIGCIDGATIQEIGGDVIFLAADGLRYLAATDRIDDVELNVVSRQVRPLLEKMDRSRGPVSSVVIPSKSQYRLYYTDSSGAAVGLVGSLMFDGSFSWSTISDMNVIDITQSLEDGVETIYHIGAPRLGALRIYKHDDSETFDGTPFVALWKTPYFNLGDPVVRKCMHSINTYIEVEGRAKLELQVRYDYDKPTVQQPAPFQLDSLNGAARFGEFIFGNGVFGSLQYSMEPTFLEGSGQWVQFIFKDIDRDNSSYIIRGFDLQFTAGGRI